MCEILLQGMVFLLGSFALSSTSCNVLSVDMEAGNRRRCTVGVCMLYAVWSEQSEVRMERKLMSEPR